MKQSNLKIWNVIETPKKIGLEFSQISFPKWMKYHGFYMIQTEDENGTKNHVLIQIDNKKKTIKVFENDTEFRKWMSNHFKNTSKKHFSVGGKYYTTLKDGTPYPHIKDTIITLIMQKGKITCDNIINNNHSFISIFDKQFLNDTKDEVYMNFGNGVVMITKNTIEFIKPSLLNNKYRYIDSLIHMNKHIDNYSGNFEITNPSEISRFEKFCILATSKRVNQNLSTLPVFNVDYLYSDDDMKTLMSAIGYLCSNYKSGGLSKFILFQDRYMDNSSRQGRNGKSVIVKSLTKFIKGALIPADKTNLKDQFAFNNISYGDKIVFFDEILPKTQFIETLFNEINGFMNVRKLHRGTFTLSGQDLPKFVGCTNYSVWDYTQMSQSQRIHCVEFSDFFNKVALFNGTPNDYFGGDWIFDNMDDLEWNKFFNFIIKCIQFYLTEGFHKHPSPLYKSDNNILSKHFPSIDKSILEWINNYIKVDRIKNKHYIKDSAPSRNGLFENLKSNVGLQIITSSGLDESKFAQLLLDVCNLLGYDFNPTQKHNGNTMNQRKLQRRNLTTKKVEYVIHIIHPNDGK